jgi:diguanylate cyclase (GGDEF)-like protein/PAS domain S-box-containing protein
MDHTKDGGFREIFEKSGSVLLLVEPQSGSIVDANPAAVDFYGYSRERLLGMSMSQINTLAWEDVALERKRAIFPERNAFNFRHRLASGEERDVEVYFSPFQGNGRPLLFSIVHEVTGFKHIQKELQASETMYRAAFETILDAVSITRLHDGMFIEVNRAFLELTGHARAEVIGRTSVELGLLEADDRPQLIEGVRREASVNREIKLRRRDGNPVWCICSFSETEIDGTPCLFAVLKDISVAKEAEDRIRKLAFYDPLTQLPNRRLFLDRLQQVLAEGARSRRRQALLLIDIDDFRALNDSLGHKIGDLLLQEIAARLTFCTQEVDTVARLGGDEFAIILENLSNIREEAAAHAMIVAEKILQATGRTCLLAGHEYRGAASIGIKMVTKRLKNPGLVLQRAETALSQAKEAGGNSIRFFSPAAQAVANARVAMADDLRRAIATDQLLLHYQPQVDPTRLIGAEALVRWNHPTLGILSPDKFIPLAEETGLILSLGGWVLNRVCSQVAEWASRHPMARFSVAINVSAQQFQDPGFVSQVLSSLHRAGANPGNIKLELTESMLVETIDDVISKMSQLKSHGLRVSVDDFGTGYSSLAYLKRLPLDELKIDRSFVKDILVDASSRAIAQTIISLGRAMGFLVIAEGVETDEQWDFLMRLGCHSCQGYLFSRPLPAAEFERLWLAPCDDAVPRAGDGVQVIGNQSAAQGSGGGQTASPEPSSYRIQLAYKLLSQKLQIAASFSDELFLISPAWASYYTEQGRQLCAAEARSVVEFLAGAIEADSPEAFEDYARWQARVFGARGVGVQVLVETLNQLERNIAPILLPHERGVVSTFLARGRGACVKGEPSSAATLGASPADVTVSAFLDAMLEGQRQTALDIIEDTIRSGARHLDIYVDVIAEALHKVGTLWEQNKISVAQEHVATAIAQFVIASISDRPARTPSDRGMMVVTGVAGERHQIGANLVAEAMERHGWRVRFLGTNLPHGAVLEMTENISAEVLCISTTLVANLPSTVELVNAVRAKLGQTAPRIVLGGAAFQWVSPCALDVGSVEIFANLREAVEMLCPWAGRPLGRANQPRETCAT